MNIFIKKIDIGVVKRFLKGRCAFVCNVIIVVDVPYTCLKYNTHPIFWTERRELIVEYEYTPTLTVK